MTTLRFELVSPEKRLLGKKVAMVVVPGLEGDYGVLPAHAPMITTLRPGVIEVYEMDETTISDRIFVSGGFAKVTGEECTLLAEDAVPVSELNRSALEAELKTIDAALASDDTDALESRRAMIRAKLQAAA